ncbi:MAG TPA: DUF5654 family protein [Patescibacteria group bacterium]|nr:DUF5654 family protein [Patescibacteria group bacterium]
MAKIVRRFRKHFSGMRREILGQMLTLSTSGFGLVAALAWNELIKEVVQNYIKPLAGESSGIISLFIYAVIITLLAVLVTYNLTKLVKR